MGGDQETRLTSLTHTPLSSLTPDPRNARTHDERNLALIEAALREVGAARFIVVDETGTILAGNATVQAAEQAGLVRVRIVEADGTELVACEQLGRPCYALVSPAFCGVVVQRWEALTGKQAEREPGDGAEDAA